MTRKWLWWVCLGIGLLASPALSENANQELLCPDQEEQLSPPRLLRSLSLELRGTLPSPSEIAEVQEEGLVPDHLLDDMIDSPEFAQRVVRLHRDLLWNKVTNVRLLTASAMMAKETGTNLYWRGTVSTTYRGRAVSCLDEPARWDNFGVLVTTPQSDGSQREGYVMVAPYWDPSTPVKVCAFDAQKGTISPSGTPCDSREGFQDKGCGCGPDLRFCSTYALLTTVLDGMGGDVDRRIQSLIEEDRSYLDLFESPLAYVNGPMAYFLRYQAHLPANITFSPPMADPADLPDLPFTATTTWVEVDLPAEHAGILTSPAYLLRFQTNRARANRFHNAFLCDPFQAPSGGLPEQEGIPILNLQKREGCSWCHAELEPSAAYWGRWSDSGAGWLDPDTYSAQRSDCSACALGGGNCPTLCKRYYITDPLSAEEDPWLGWFKPYEFLSSADQSHVELGPRHLAQLAVVDGRLPVCVARTAVKWLLGREATEGEEPWVQQLALDFVAGGYHYRDLVRDIVTSDTWRRVQ